MASSSNASNSWAYSSMGKPWYWLFTPMSRDTKSHAVVSNACPSMPCFKSAVVHPVVATMWAGARLSPSCKRWAQRVDQLVGPAGRGGDRLADGVAVAQRQVAKHASVLDVQAVVSVGRGGVGLTSQKDQHTRTTRGDSCSCQQIATILPDLIHSSRRAYFGVRKSR